MSNIAGDFVANFHSLEGTTLAERRKNFFKLLHQNSALKNNSEALDSISSNLNPRTFSQDLFRLDFLIYFRRKQELLELLKEGNSVFVSKIAKEIWFFKEAFDGVLAEEIVNEILPNLSFSVRMKILRKLSRYSSREKFDKIFDVLVIRYGMYIASQFIAGCTLSKIKQIIVEYPIALTSKQLIILHGQDREIIDFYFSNSQNSIQKCAYKSLLKYIYENDRPLFDNFKKKFYVCVKLGRRATKKLVTVEKENIISNPHNYNYYVNMKAVLRKLGKDSLRLFFNALPPKIESCLNRDSVIRHFAKRYHYSLFVKAFPLHYKIKFEDYPEFINDSLLGLCQDDTERAALAKIKVAVGHDDYIKYLLTDEAIQLLKEKINLTSDIWERGQLIKQLVETCHINNNIKALYTVMKYFCFRHKNDDLSVHLQFIRNIEQLFGFKEFNEEMWECLNELLTIHMLKFDRSEATYQKFQTLPLVAFNRGTSTFQKLSYLEFVFKKGDTIDELIKEYFTDNRQIPTDKYDRNFRKYFLLFVINHIAKFPDPSVDNDRYDTNVSFNCDLISEISAWNNCYEDKLSFYDYPVLSTTFDHVIRNCQVGYYRNVKSLFFEKIFTLEENSYRKEYLEIFWRRFGHFGTLREIKWFLKYEPLQVLAHFDTVFSALTASETDSKYRLKIWHVVKKMSHLQIAEKIVQLCLVKLSDESCLELKPKFIPCLAVLMKPEEFAALADSYKPENRKLDLRNEKEVRLYNLQCAVAEQFRHVTSYRVVPSLLHYSTGDYLKSALRSLYSLLYRTPENQLPQFLNHLSKKAVSVRKHALFMTCELCNLTQVEDTIKLLNKQEQDQSLKKHMFATTIKYFVKNPSDQFFELVKLNMLFINHTDDESLKSLTEHLGQMPDRYKARYVQYAWQFLEKALEVWLKLKPLKEDLIRVLSVEILKQIPLEFGLEIIQKHFFTEKAARDLSGIDNFIFDFVSVQDDRAAIFYKVFDLLDQYKFEEKVFLFLQDWYRRVMDRKRYSLKYMQPFVDYYEKKVSITERFHDFLKLFYLKVKLELEEEILVEELSSKVLAFFEEILKNYGFYVVDLFAEELNSNLSYFTENNYGFYYSLLGQRPTDPNVAILVLKMVSQPHSSYRTRKNEEELLTFNKILQHIMNIDNTGLQINLQCKFKNYIKSDKFLKLSSTSMEVDD